MRRRGRATGWVRGVGEIQQSRSVVHATRSTHVISHPFAGVTQSHEGPASTGGRGRSPGAVPRASATHAPAARSSTQPPGSQGPAGAGSGAGLSVHCRATHAHDPGGGDERSHATGSGGPPTQRRGAQGSSQRQSVSVAQAAPTLGSAATAAAAVALAAAAAALAAAAVALAAAGGVAGAGVSAVEGAEAGVEQAAKSVSRGAARRAMGGIVPARRGGALPPGSVLISEGCYLEPEALMKISRLRPLFFFAPFLLAGSNCVVEADPPQPALAPPTTHRRQALACPARQYAEGASPPSLEARRPAGATAPQAVVAGPEFSMPCVTQADCAEQGAESRCSSNDDGKTFFCRSDRCFVDSDCGGSEVCHCAEEGGSFEHHCLSGNCRVDADCGPRGFCSPSQDNCGKFGGFDGYYCHTPEDECNRDADCGDSYGDTCLFQPAANRWVCFRGESCVG